MFCYHQNDARSDMSQLADGIQGVNMNSSQQSHISQQGDYYFFV